MNHTLYILLLFLIENNSKVSHIIFILLCQNVKVSYKCLRPNFYMVHDYVIDFKIDVRIDDISNLNYSIKVLSPIYSIDRHDD